MGCSPCQKAKEDRMRAAGETYLYTFPEGRVDPQTGRSTKLYRTKHEAVAAKTRFGGGTYKVQPQVT